MASRKKQLFSNETVPIVIFFILFGLIIVVFSLMHEQFLSVRNISTLLKHASISAIFALGVTFVVVVGHFDLSFPMVCALAGMTNSFLIAKDIHVVLSVAAGLAVGVFFGLLNGLAVGKLKMPDIVTTVGIGAIAWGFAYMYSGGAYIYGNVLTSGILELNDAVWLGIPLPAILMGAFYLLGYLILHRSRFGRCFYSTGDNRVAAIFSGVNVKLYILAAFIICAALASFGAIMSNASQGQGNVRVGLVFLLSSYATVFLGSAVFKKPTIYGTLFAALFIATMLNGFTLMAISYFYMDFIIGMVLITALCLSTDIVFRKRAAKAPSGVPDSMEEVGS
ncbi:MAG: ABC transporter permease [Desulfobacteraceae bacterium]|nr:ABC transporter permease [Desulfobacteraceae bacterium]